MMSQFYDDLFMEIFHFSDSEKQKKNSIKHFNIYLMK